MASSKDLSTRQCPAEHRAWLLIYQKRFGWGKPLVRAFSHQFPERQQQHVLLHAAQVRIAKVEVQTQLLELAKQFSWYEDEPGDGEKNYRRMKKLERRQAARERRDRKGDGEMEEGSES